MSPTPHGTVVVTGASSGIGRATALRLDSLGYRVFAGVRRETDGETLAHDASERLRPIFIDVTDESQIAAAAETVRGATGDAGLAGLINNAGIAVGGPLELLPLDRLRSQLEINVIGQVAVTQALLPQIRRATGRIVNIGSISGRSSLPLVGAYSASKFALEAVTDALRVELMPWNIHVSIVEPGAVATPIWERSLEAAETLLDEMDEEAEALYGPAIRAVRERALRAPDEGIPTDDVVDAIEHALTARRPKTRYLVGRDAKLRALLQRLPDRLRDRIIASQLERLAEGAHG